MNKFTPVITVCIIMPILTMKAPVIPITIMATVNTL